MKGIWKGQKAAGVGSRRRARGQRHPFHSALALDPETAAAAEARAPVPGILARILREKQVESGDAASDRVGYLRAETPEPAPARCPVHCLCWTFCPGRSKNLRLKVVRLPSCPPSPPHPGPLPYLALMWLSWLVTNPTYWSIWAWGNQEVS